MAVKGLEFGAVPQGRAAGFQTLGGKIPFDETINAPDLEEKGLRRAKLDSSEDLNAEMINSPQAGRSGPSSPCRCANETLRDVEAAVDVDMGNGGLCGPRHPGDATGPAQIETFKAHRSTWPPSPSGARIPTA